jgi:hypothetical protein
VQQLTTPRIQCVCPHVCDVERPPERRLEAETVNLLANASDLEKIIGMEEVEDSKPELIWQDVEKERLLVASNLEFPF